MPECLKKMFSIVVICALVCTMIPVTTNASAVDTQRLAEECFVVTGEQLQDVGSLVTEEYYFTEVVSFSSVKKLFKTIALGITESSYLASYDGIISAGLDFEKISVEKDDENKVITIRLPKSEVKYMEIDTDSFVLYSEKEGLGNKITLNDYNDSLIELEKNAKNKAVDRGLLKRADENAKLVISNFVKSLVDTSDYTVRYVTG